MALSSLGKCGETNRRAAGGGGSAEMRQDRPALAAETLRQPGVIGDVEEAFHGSGDTPKPAV
jgi:hypothetical protein